MGSGKRGPIKEKDEENAHYLDPQKQVRKEGKRKGRIWSHRMGFERSILWFRRLNEVEEDKLGKEIVG